MSLNKGFTLAEILLTLVIIGIIASLTIPSLIQNTQEAEYKVAFKKIYASFSQAAMEIESNNGGTILGSYYNSTDLLNLFANKMPMAKICPEYTDQNLCFNDSKNKWHNLQGDNGWVDFYTDGAARAVLNNGMTIVIKDRTHSACNDSVNSVVQNGQYVSCGYAYVDVNGFKPPNTVGKDIFGFYITKYGIYPTGATGSHVSDSNLYCSSNSTNVQNGNGCSALVLMNKTY